jgi:hypothetical protein
MPPLLYVIHVLAFNLKMALVDTSTYWLLLVGLVGLLLELGQKNPCDLKIFEKNCCDPVTASLLDSTFWVIHYRRVEKNFFYNMDIIGNKIRRI